MQPRSPPTYRYTSTRCYVANSYKGKSVHFWDKPCIYVCMYVRVCTQGVLASSEEWSLLQIIVTVSSLPICFQCQTWPIFPKIILLKHVWLINSSRKWNNVKIIIRDCRPRERCSTGVGCSSSCSVVLWISSTLSCGTSHIEMAVGLS